MLVEENVDVLLESSLSMHTQRYMICYKASGGDMLPLVFHICYVEETGLVGLLSFLLEHHPGGILISLLSPNEIYKLRGPGDRESTERH